MSPPRLVHLSDLHLGFRSFERVERGWNLRERDVAAAFQRAVHEIGRLRPTAVLLTGNVFDHPDPPSTAFLTLTRGIRALQTAVPDVTVLAIAGERDTPRTPADPGPLAVLDSLPGVEAAAGAPRAVRLGASGVHALLVPHRAVMRPPFPELRPDPGARWNVLLLRGTPIEEAASPPIPGGPPPLEVNPEGWDYVALGAGHRAHAWSDRIRAAGSLERVGGNPWREANDEKGFVVFDLERGEGEFHPVPGRPVVDLAPVRVSASDPEGGSERLRHVVEGVPGGVEGKIVRLRFRGDVRIPEEGVAPGLLAAIRTRTAHLEVLLEAERPTVAARSAGTGGESPELVWRGGDGARGALSLGGGIWGLSGSGERDVALLAELLGEAVREGVRGTAGPVLAESRGSSRLRVGLAFPTGTGAPADLELLIHGDPDPARLLHRGAQLLARIARAQIPAEPTGGSSEGAPVPVTGTSSEPDTGQDERELRVLRADWIEAAGDLEARTLEWARERQEADSRLGTYRDRARELRARLRDLETEGSDALCPACGRPLDEAHPRFRELLHEEWEGVVQDGRWWKRRREQLDEKPVELRDLERRALRLHAAVEAATGRVRDGRGRQGGEHSLESNAGAADPDVRGLAAAESEELLRAAGDVLRRVTEGAIQGLALGEGGGLELDTDGSRRTLPAPGDVPLVAAALHLALDAAAAARGLTPPLRVWSQLHADGAPARVARFLELAACGSGPNRAGVPTLVPMPAETAGRVPETLVGIVELGRDARGRPRLRAGPAGRARIVLRADARGG